MKAIETVYRGFRFRSRLEARWAVFFDALGIKWRYETEGYDLGGAGYYLPDFFLHYNEDYHARFVPDFDPAGHWVEIKPVAPSLAEQRKMVELSKHTMHSGMIFVGSPGDGIFYSTSRKSSVCSVWNPLGFMTLIDRVVWPLDRFIPNGKRGYDDIVKAFELSRGARFEHGEMPKALV